MRDVGCNHGEVKVGMAVVRVRVRCGVWGLLMWRIRKPAVMSLLKAIGKTTKVFNTNYLLLSYSRVLRHSLVLRHNRVLRHSLVLRHSRLLHHSRVLRHCRVSHHSRVMGNRRLLRHNSELT